METDEPLSYFQIAGKETLKFDLEYSTMTADIEGIHGLPYTTWPKREWNKDIPGKKIDPEKDWFGGFCTHSSILFLTWHRPYLALFEVCLVVLFSAFSHCF